MGFLACALLVIATIHATSSLKYPEEITDNISIRNRRGVTSFKPTCEPGHSFKFYCNICVCGLDGITSNASCSRDRCYSGEFNEDGTRNEPEESDDNTSIRNRRGVTSFKPTCEPGHSFKFYCNICVCGLDGITSNASCSRDRCYPGEFNEDGTRNEPEESDDNTSIRNRRGVTSFKPTCEPGHSFKFYCNICVCGLDGITSNASCSRDRCYPGEFNEDGTRNEPEESDDNTSIRNKRDANGNKATCIPGHSFKYYCNICVCGLDGIASNAVCSRERCYPGEWNIDGTRKYPGGNIKFTNEWTLSWRQPKEVATVSGRCVPRSIFKHYCNECYCGEDGLVDNAICTRMSCDRRYWNIDGTWKHPVYDIQNSNENSNNHFWSVQKREVEEEGRCHTGAIFKRFCNTCVCGTDRSIAHAPCTNMVCDPDEWNEDGTRKHPEKDEIDEIDILNEEYGRGDDSNVRSVKKREAEEEGRCHTGAIFKRFCNTCVCGTDRSIARAPCTNMVCDPEEWNEDGTRKHPEKDEIDEIDILNEEYGLGDDSNVHSVKKREAEEEGRCHTGAIFKRFCNTCVCGTDRSIAAAPCTNMVCDPEEWNEDGTRKHPEKDEIDEIDILNEEYGLGDDSNVHSVKKREAEEEGRCHTGAIFKRFCNTCVCGTDRSIARAPCTNMVCDPEEWNEDGTRKHPEKDEIDEIDILNEEYGLGDGSNVHSVKKREAEEEGRCHTGAIFKRFCNTCVCGTDRSIAAAPCTNMVCDPEEWNEDGTRKHPEKDEIDEIDILNEEYGLGDGSNVHSVKKREAEEEGRCHTGAIFKRFCNTCVCGTDRSIAAAPCTNMVCDPEEWNEDGTRKHPEKDEIDEIDILNEEYGRGDDSNVHSVKKREAEEEGRCHTGAIFKRFCNTCVCGTDRSIARAPCTNMVCDPEEWHEDGTRKHPEKDEIDEIDILNEEYGRGDDSNVHSVKKREAGGEGRCRTGAIFRKFCNYCVCGTDGTIAGSPCTSMRCNPKIWNEDGTMKSDFVMAHQ